MMIRNTIFASLAAFAIAAAPAAAKDQSQPAPASAESNDQASGDKADSERKICKRYQRTGTRMKSDKLCLTAEGWKIFNRAK